MKSFRNIAISMILLAFVFSGVVLAKPVNKMDAEKMVTGWLKTDPKPLDAKLGGQIAETEVYNGTDGKALYYVVYLDPSGFVIVSADDQAEPVVAFVSGDGLYDPSPENPLGALIGKDLPKRIEEARKLQKEADGGKALSGEKGTANGKWKKLTGGDIMMPMLASISDVRVATLIQSRWNQGDVAGSPCYNYYTPNNYVCGCVATAFAQLVRYYQYQPAGGIGVHTFPITVNGNPQNANTRGGNGSGGAYNWSDMVLVPGTGITTVQRQAIGALCYDCGVTVEMGYSAGGSGAYQHYIARSLKDIFGYSNAIITYHDWYNQDSGMLGMINPNLDAGIPVMFSVWDQGSSEHSIICDGYGYQSSTMYHHINMGWGGSEDAWYNIPAIDGGYSVIDSITYNIYTTGTGEIISGRVTDGSGAPMSGITVTATGPGGPYTATTNSRGIYALAKVHSNSTYAVSAGESGCSFSPSSQNVTTGTSTGGQLSSGNVWGINFTGTCTPLAILEYIGPNGSASPWETAANWYDLDGGAHRVPTNTDIARVYNALGLGFTNSNATVSSTTAICQKLQMRYLTTKLTVLTGGKLTTTGSVEMYQGDSSQLDIQAGATMDACTRANTTSGTFKVANDGATYGSDTVNVYGTLNVVSQVPGNGTSDLQICNVSGGMGTGTINVYAGGLLNVEAYSIGSYGTGRIYITPGGTMTIKGDVRTQVNADKSSHKISGAGGAVVTATYNAGENKTYVTAAGGGPPPAPVYEGYEPLTTGGEGGTVIWVNNLSEGSLASALNSYGKRIVKFSVSGTIYLGYEITVTQPYLTIDGSSAPGNGITLVGWGAYRGLAINTHDVIVSNLRFRGFPGEGIQIFGDYNIIIDHCSVTGSGDGALDINGGTHDITVQWCLFGDCMEVHRCYGIRASLHHNLYHHNNRRQPKIFEAGPSYDFRNNVVEYWTNSGTNIVNSTAGVNVINNVYGPPEPGDGSWPLGFGMLGSNSVYTAGNYNPGEDVDSQGDLNDPVPEPNVTTDVANEDLRTYVRGKAGALPRDATDESYAGPEVTDTTPPEAPTGLNVTTYSSNKLSLSWNANTDEEIANYNVYRSTSQGGTYTNVGSPAMNSYLDTGLSASTTYYYKITAVDLFDNESSYSAVDSAATAAPDSTPPCVPSGLAASGHDAFVTLDWEECTDSDLFGYNVYRSTSSGGTYTLIAGAGSVTGSSYTDNSVTNKVTYYYKVSSVDTSDNESAQCAYVSATPLDITPPTAPTALTAVGKDDFVPLNWNDNPEPDIAGYNVYRSTTSGGPYSQIAAAASVPNSAYTDNNVDNYTVYYYVVKAVDTSDNESPNSNEASAMPEPDLIPPAVPSGVSATAASCTRIDINWNDNTEEDFGSYRVYYSTVSGGPYTLLKDGLTVSAYSDADLNPGTLRYYVVKAVDLVGNASANSSQVSATTAQPNYYVDGLSGLDTNPGTSASPWKTISKAASMLTAGQTVLIRPGTYTETVAPANHGEDATPITYLADSAGPVIVQAVSSSDYVFDMGKRCTVLSGLTIRNGDHGVYLGSYSRNCELRNCVIYNNAQDGVYTRNGYYKFHNCLIYENSLDGMRLGADPGVIVTKCTIVNNGEDGMEVDHLTDQVIDSIIVRNDEDGIEAGAIALKYCDVWDNSMNDYLGGAYPGEGTISEDPCFVNPVAGDYRLNSGSPCIGTASDGGNMGYTPTAKEYMAHSPNPANGLDGLDVTIILSWSAGVGAASHDVYLGTSSSAVNNATRASAEFKGNQTLTNYDPTLSANTTYYWRIDEIDNLAVTHKGLVWKFVTKPANMPAANYYVNVVTGNDNNLGTSPAQAWKTIQKAANTMVAGKTVLVFPGTYPEAVNHTVNAGTSGNPIVYRAYYESGPVLINATGKSYGFRNIKAYITLDGFEVYGANANGILITGDAADYCIVKNCKVRNNGSDGVKIDAGDYATVQNCLIYDNGTNGIEAVSNGEPSTIDNCTIYSNNNGDGIHSGSCDGTVTDCIISGNSQWGIDSANTLIINVSYTDTWGNTSGSYDDLTKIIVGTGCKSQDPLFVNPGTFDFHLQSGSPCKNADSSGTDMGYHYIN